MRTTRVSARSLKTTNALENNKKQQNLQNFKKKANVAQTPATTDI